MTHFPRKVFYLQNLGQKMTRKNLMNHKDVIYVWFAAKMQQLYMEIPDIFAVACDVHGF